MTLRFENKPSQPDDSMEGKEKLVKRILFADDEPDIVNLMQEVLTRQGYIVDTVGDGQQLLDKLTDGKEKYDLVITDNNMPKIDGIEVLQKMRADNRFKDLPVIVCTGRPDTEKEKIVREAGGKFLQKPVSIDNLRATVKEVFVEQK